METNALMPWVRFTANFDWKPTLKVMYAYRAGSVHLVHSRCAEQAIRAGKAEPCERPERTDSFAAYSKVKIDASR